MTDRRLVYTKIRTIGQGSYGVVHLTRSKEDRKLYVMKVVKNVASGDGRDKEAVHEVNMLASLQHPNIVAFKEAFTSPDERDLHIVMHYCDSGDLHQRIEKARQRRMLIPEEQILDWFVQIALALAYLHSRHILHRDLKPQNIFLTNSNRVVKVGDVGIAKSLEDTNALAHTKIGTPYYFSPELCRDHPYSYASDVWALGALTYETVCLRVPFEAENMPQLMTKILRTKPPAPTHHYSNDLRNLLGAMLAKSPRRRPTMQQILALPFLRARLQALIAKYGEGQAVPASVGVNEGEVAQVTTEREQTATGTKVTTTVTVTEAPPEEGKQLEPLGPQREPAAASRAQFEATMARLLQEQQKLQARLKRKQERLERARARAVAAGRVIAAGEDARERVQREAQERKDAEQAQREAELEAARVEQAAAVRELAERREGAVSAPPGATGEAADSTGAADSIGAAAADPQAATDPQAASAETKAAEDESDSDDGADETNDDVDELSETVNQLQSTLHGLMEEAHSLEAEGQEDQEIQQVADMCRSTLTSAEPVPPHEPPEEPDDEGVGPNEDGFDGQHAPDVDAEARGSAAALGGALAGMELRE